MITVQVHNRQNLEAAIRAFKRKVQKEGVIRELKVRRAFEKPGEKKERKRKENIAKRKRNWNTY